MKVIQDADTREFTSFKAGGSAEIYFPDSLEDLQGLLAVFHEQGRDFVFLGNGSNTLFRDGRCEKPVIKLGPSFSVVKVYGTKLFCGAGALMSQVAQTALEAELTGFEKLSGIPGSVGGAVFMNAGAYGSEMKDLLVCAELVSRDGSEVRAVMGDELDLSYRHSALEESGEVVTSVILDLAPGVRRDIGQSMREINRERAAKQPLRYPSCGSFFKRPPGHFAGKLVQDAGLKGLTVGGAQVSVKHSGFVINRGGATAQDILDLMALVQNIVRDRFGVDLEPEVRII